MLSLPALFSPRVEIFINIWILALVPLLFAGILLPLITRINAALIPQEIVKPNWNDNPFKMIRPLSFFQFGAYFFFLYGVFSVIGGLIRFQSLNLFGVTSVSFGLGIFAGIWITLLWERQSR